MDLEVIQTISRSDAALLLILGVASLVTSIHSEYRLLAHGSEVVEEIYMGVRSRAWLLIKLCIGLPLANALLIVMMSLGLGILMPLCLQWYGLRLIRDTTIFGHVFVALYSTTLCVLALIALTTHIRLRRRRIRRAAS